MDDLYAVARIYELIGIWQGRRRPGAKCSGCNDIGFYLSAPEQIGNYPPGTPISQRRFTEPTLQPCNCKSNNR